MVRMGEHSNMVSDAMSSVVLTVGPDHTLQAAAVKMAERGVGSAVVVDPDGYGPGIVAERDIVRAVAAGKDLNVERVADHMARDTVVATPSWPIEHAAAVMMKGRCRHLVVVEGREVVGVVSIRDIVAAWEPLAASANAQGGHPLAAAG
jgi:CBS domain-containing protein